MSDRPRTSVRQRSREIAERLAEGVEMPPIERLRNSGRRRTESKRELLRRLAEVARAAGVRGWGG